ncbi:class I SAM-dependent methyltransferase [Pedobacter mucosus]|uniref:class I SAM-dependent methyltransferase n=1 Tax=Pedobacter mucosus TaxID=2895286 RepID=UPI001EE4376E|nr:class I SAM-dependent methyltransferase [Pedobacter mucosus]UKT63314.1 class I SAM-dependent methyltransferase [Pedobacter mucosus]
MNTFTALTTLIAKPNRLKALLSYGHKGYLNSIGWFTAFDKKQAVDGKGEALPWVTYSFIDFIKERINKSQHIFEYGSGSSTIFYALRAGTVTSVEHDKSWFEKVKNTSPANADMIFCALERDGEYAKKATLLNKKFDIIIVDGRDRVNCCKYSVSALSENGVLVLDDSEREVYNQARVLLKSQGFKEISFSGISPGLFYEKATSVFYKTNNCLGI